MEEIKNLMETIQKENKNAIVVWSEVESSCAENVRG